MNKQKLNKFLADIHLPHWLTLLLTAVLIFRIPNLFEPYSYGDETIYLTLGEGIRQGLTLYKDIHDNKPPLLYFLSSIAGGLFWLKVILLFWSLGTIVIFFKLTQVLFPKRTVLQKIAVAAFALLTTIPTLEGNIGNAENFLIGPVIWGIYIVFSKKATPRNLLFSGFLFSIATLFKVPAAFDIFTIIFFWLIFSVTSAKSLKQFIKDTSILLIGFLTPILLSFVYYFAKGAGREYFTTVFLQNIGYLSTFRPGDVAKPFLIKNGPLILRGLIVLFGLAILYFKRKKLDKVFTLATIWLLFSLFAITLSERPYPHYLLQAAAPVALLIAILVGYKTRFQTLAVIPLTLALFVPVYFKFYYYPTFSYYTRFLQFATNRISKDQYFDKFDNQVNTNYQIAQFIKTSTTPKDKVFILGNSSNIYALSHRLPPTKYVAEYHIFEFSTKAEVLKTLTIHKPVIIAISRPEEGNWQEIKSLLARNYFPLNSIDGFDLWHIIKAYETK